MVTNRVRRQGECLSSLIAYQSHSQVGIPQERYSKCRSSLHLLSHRSLTCCEHMRRIQFHLVSEYYYISQK